MLDKRSAKMMSALLQFCADGSYKIIEIRDLVKAMLPRYKFDADGISQVIKYLAGNEMIDVKYSDENVYCIAVLPKGRVYEESETKTKKSSTVGGWLIAILVSGCFFASFLGALVAGFIK